MGTSYKLINLNGLFVSSAQEEIVSAQQATKRPWRTISSSGAVSSLECFAIKAQCFILKAVSMAVIFSNLGDVHIYQGQLKRVFV